MIIHSNIIAALFCIIGSAVSAIYFLLINRNKKLTGEDKAALIAIGFLGLILYVCGWCINELQKDKK